MWTLIIAAAQFSVIEGKYSKHKQVLLDSFNTYLPLRPHFSRSRFGEGAENEFINRTFRQRNIFICFLQERSRSFR